MVRHTSDATHENKDELAKLADEAAVAMAAAYIAWLDKNPKARQFEPAVLTATVIGNLYASCVAAAKATNFCADCVQAGFDFGFATKSDIFGVNDSKH